MTRTRERKLSASARRRKVLGCLSASSRPITGGELADKMAVSRQVIVQDISLLRARNHPIIATSQGYLFLSGEKPGTRTRVVACRHTLEETEDELNLIVDCGVTVVNVTVEHPLYGEITGSLMIRNRTDVRLFISKLHQTNASLLSSLTKGVHLHQLEAAEQGQLDRAVSALKKAGYLL
ncbi:transcription repressor NadR [Sporolactobacillus sp. Y61]|uniref:Transcription repressor NadR n=1 Tax=Sporolactobacillus sp. Y61 TaxID=3160863 RepID=A0AAU8IEH7_9BACL|nr:transcription repressor NadR [Sporolactobacillus sp. THM19-2]RYL94695.1 transcription repressor NadR [Sporolactobacillus sp. THM19-2]